MLFNSALFLLVFLPIVLLVYFSLRRTRLQNAFLVFASCVFYASWDWRFLFPLLCTTGLDYWISRRIEAGHQSGMPRERLKPYLMVSVCANLGLLGFFKYFNFLADTVCDLGQQLGMNTLPPEYDIILPVAISFYTFQALSYTIDVYRGELHATRSFWDFFLAVLYFPHLVAGPIQRASNLLPQVINPRRFDIAQATEGLHLVIWGFFKKVYIADNLAPIVDAAFGTPNPGGGVALIGIVAFAFQIYCDFSGYTDIARGLAKIMGFEFQLNFNLPYFATNPSDFWRRWHISLSSWLRDYLYRSLGGNRDGTFKTYRNLMLTMLLGGLWHGAAWNFVLWGFYHGSLLVIHRLSQPVLLRVGGALGAISPLWFGLRIAFMFLLTCYGWLLFRATSFDQIAEMTRALSTPLQGLDVSLVQRMLMLVAPLLLVQWLQWKTNRLYFLDPVRVGTGVRVASYALMLYCILFLGGVPQSFVYFQF